MGVSSGTSSSRGVLALRANRRRMMVNIARRVGTGRRGLLEIDVAIGAARVVVIRVLPWFGGN
jgi:hypothetical protein